MKKPNKRLDRWAKQLAFDKAFAADRLVKDGELVPLFVLHKQQPNTIMTPLLTPFRDPEQKRQVHQFIAAALIAHDCVGFSYLSECWLRALPPGEDPRAAMRRVEREGPMPSVAEDRQEVLMITIVYRDDADERMSIGAMGDIIRDAKGKVSHIQWDDDFENGELLDGAVLEIMGEDAPTPSHRSIAAHMLRENGPAIMKHLGIVEGRKP
jgi:hypothetical protein